MIIASRFASLSWFNKADVSDNFEISGRSRRLGDSKPGFGSLEEAGVFCSLGR